jgi:hypothetical protein
VVAIDNKIEQAMVSEWHYCVIPSPYLAAAYVTLGRTEGVGAKALAKSLRKPTSCFAAPWRP